MDETGSDIVIGNRMSDASMMPVTRRVTNKFMSYMISGMCGRRIPDTQCGFKLIKRGVLEAVNLKSSNYEIESELILKAASEYRPHYLCDYLLDLAAAYSKFYNTSPVLAEGVSTENRSARLELVNATKIVLKNGLETLGITALERM